MSLDRFVHWTSLRPSLEDLASLLEDYFGGAAKLVWEPGPRFVATMHYCSSHALRRVRHAPQVLRDAAQHESDQHEPRVIEVFVHDDCIDIITRHADEFTNAVASGLAALCTRVWDGRLEGG